jgi:hypothetical protein
LLALEVVPGLTAADLVESGENEREGRRGRREDARRFLDQRTASDRDLLTMFQRWDHAFVVRVASLARGEDVDEAWRAEFIEVEKDALTIMGSYRGLASDEVGDVSWGVFCDYAEV